MAAAAAAAGGFNLIDAVNYATEGDLATIYEEVNSIYPTVVGQRLRDLCLKWASRPNVATDVNGYQRRHAFRKMLNSLIYMYNSDEFDSSKHVEIRVYGFMDPTWWGAGVSMMQASFDEPTAFTYVVPGTQLSDLVRHLLGEADAGQATGGLASAV